MGIRSGQAPNFAKVLGLLAQGHLEGAFQVQQIMAGLRQGPRVPTVLPCKFDEFIKLFYPHDPKKALNACYSTLPGLDEEGGADPLSGPAARRTGCPTSDEDAGPGALQGAEEDGRKGGQKDPGGLRRRGTSDTIPERSDARSTSEEDKEEEEDESPAGGRRKRTASAPLEAELPKRGRASLPEESTAAADSGPAWDPRAQPLVNS